MIKDLVPDREICQEAKDKGVVIESEYWYKIGDKTNTVNIITAGKLDIGNIHFSYCPAPLTDEILKVLPWKVKVSGVVLTFKILKVEDEYRVGYQEIYSVDKKLSNALLLL
jgi:hypothetical protein